MNKLINISQVSKLLNLVDAKTGKPQNHIIRYWEKEFKQIDPKIINKRRYYSKKNLELLMLIKYLLKDRGMTIKGAKIYNVATNKKHTVAEIIHNISSQIKDDCEVSYEGNTPGDMFGIFGDYSKINNDLGWSPKVNFQKGLNQMILNMEHISTVD